MTYMETGSVDPAYNLAFEEYILTHRLEGDYLLLWQNDKSVIIGQNQNTEAEVDPAFISQHGIRVVRRSTGGGAVYHDLGNLNYSFITDFDEDKTVSFRQFLEPVVRFLHSLGLPAEISGRNDILIAGKKVSGTAQRIYRNRVLHHGTLLFGSNTNMLSGALRPDPEKIRAKGIASVRSRVANIRDFLDSEVTLIEFWDHLKAFFLNQGYVSGVLGLQERLDIDKLQKEKYDTWEWNYGRSPRSDISNHKRWSGGGLEFRAALDNGRIESIQFFGDFLSRMPLDRLTAALRGCRFSREDFSEVLDRFPIECYFGAITKDEVLNTVFDL